MNDEQHEREIRAARNQALFRAVNEKMRQLNTTLGALTERFVIACECADRGCLMTLDIGPAEYERIRSHPNQFAVLSGHVYPEVESVVDETERYVVVEKRGMGMAFAEATDPRDDAVGE